MDIELYAAFVVATAILMLIPGPNVALVVANAVAHGRGQGLATVAGTSAAMVVQLSLVALGLTSLLGTLGTWFEWLRWLGVLYLVGLAIRAFVDAPPDLAAVAPDAARAGGAVLRGFLVSLANPKTLFFYGAFFPQFLSANRPGAPQVLVLSVTFLGLAVAIDTGWALLASRLRGVLSGRARWRSRVGGTVYAAAALGLAAARRPAA